MYFVLFSFGLEVEWTTKGAAYKAIHALQAGKSVEYAAGHLAGCQWKKVGPSVGQLGLMRRESMPRWAMDRATNWRNGSLLLDAWMQPAKLVAKLLKEIDKANTASQLDSVCRDVALVNGVLPAEHYEQLKAAGRERRQEIGTDDIPK